MSSGAARFRRSAAAAPIVVQPNKTITFFGGEGYEKGVGLEQGFVQTWMTLQNPSARKRACFKIKSNAPTGRFSVAPNSGIVEPEQMMRVRVTLHLSSSELDRRKTSDLRIYLRELLQQQSYRFMVQSLVVPKDAMRLDAIWKSVPSEHIFETKMPVTFASEDGDPRDGGDAAAASGGRRRGEHVAAAAASGGRRRGEHATAAGDDATAARADGHDAREETDKRGSSVLVAAPSAPPPVTAAVAAPAQAPAAQAPTTTADLATAPASLENIFVKAVYAAFAIFIVGIIVGRFGFQ